MLPARRLMRVPQGCLVQPARLHAGARQRWISKHAPGPRQFGVLVETPAEGEHQIGVLADVAFDDDVISSGALDALPNRRAGALLAEGGALLREELVEVDDHTIFKPARRGPGEGIHLFAAELHGPSLGCRFGLTRRRGDGAGELDARAR